MCQNMELKHCTCLAFIGQWMKMKRLIICLSAIALYGIILKMSAYFQVTVPSFRNERVVYKNRIDRWPDFFGLEEPVYLDFDYFTHKPIDSRKIKQVNLPTLSMFDTNEQMDKTKADDNDIEQVTLSGLQVDRTKAIDNSKRETSAGLLFERALEKTNFETRGDRLKDLNARTFEAKLQEAATLTTINTDQKREQTSKCFLLHRGNFDIVLQHAVRNNCSFLTNSELMARTGNQMFQIAAVIGLAHRFDLIPIIEDVQPIRDIFELPNVSKFKVSRTRMLMIEECCRYGTQVTRIDSYHNWTLSGYLQSFKYFSETVADIDEAFKVSANHLSDVDLFLKLIQVKDIQTVGIHIRRGDIVYSAAAETGYPIVDTGYITRAMRYYNELLNHKVQFIVISDDINWCEENIKSENNTVHFSPFNDITRDLALMTRCDHMIITSGSFGWWGGWLCKGHVVYYKGFPVPGSKLDTEFTLSDYYPTNWTGLD